MDSDYRYIKQLIENYNRFMQKNLGRKLINYEEAIWRSKTLSLGWEILDNRDIDYFNENLMAIKNAVQDKYHEKALEIKFLRDTGETLYCIKLKLHNLKYFCHNYNKIVSWWVEKYIKNIKSVEKKKINLSYENGLCSLLQYLLLYKKEFCDEIKEIVPIMQEAIEENLRCEELDLGMRFGMLGWLNTINLLEEKVPEIKLKKSAQDIISIYEKEEILEKDVIEWPAKIKRNRENSYTISDNWCYGTSQILFNLLNSQHLCKIKKEYYYKKLLYQSFQTVEDFGLINPDFYAGYAGCLKIYTQCALIYQTPSFWDLQNRIMKTLVATINADNRFTFYKYINKNGHLVKKIEEKELNLIKNYQIYCVLCEVLDSLEV